MAARLAPAIFVLLWSTGFIGTKYALEGAEPFTMQTLRMVSVVVVLGVLAAIVRPTWPDRAGVMHSVVASILVHGFYLGGTAVAIAHSVPAGLSALIPGLQPVLTSTLANRFLGEKVAPTQWLGLLLGLGGVMLVLHNRSFEGQSAIGWAASGVSLVSITIGTLYQKRFCSHIDWRAGNFIQFIAVSVIHWTPTFVLSVGWLAVVLSVGSIGVLYWLIRKSAATQVASLFYLVPGVTALMAYILFDERLDALSIAGMVVCAAGVVLVNRR
jgi:drug/metabolite transporter (DMT)-like permease